MSEFDTGPPGPERLAYKTVPRWLGLALWGPQLLAYIALGLELARIISALIALVIIGGVVLFSSRVERWAGRNGYYDPTRRPWWKDASHRSFLRQSWRAIWRGSGS